MTLHLAREKASRLIFYADLREKYPTIPARTILAFIKDAPGMTLAQYVCKHEWAYTGTAYGGDDESYHGEGRAYCSLCLIDGDA